MNNKNPSNNNYNIVNDLINIRNDLIKDVTSQFYSMGTYCSVELNQKTLNSIV